MFPRHPVRVGRRPLLTVWVQDLGRTLPGLALTALLAASAFQIRALFDAASLSPLVLAILLGLGLRTVYGVPSTFKAGIKFSQKRLLRIAIVLLGLQISFLQIAALGITGLFIVTLALVATAIAMLWMAGRLGVDRRLAALIAAGTSICGASAVLAADAVVRGRDQDVAYAVGAVTLFGSVAMFVYPVLQSALALTSEEYGLWAGASIHEVAQVVAATFQAGQESGEFGIITKLSRVLLLAPMIVLLGLWFRGREGMGATGQVPFPWFVAGFLAMIVVNSLGILPAEVTLAAAQASPFLLSMALAALGLEMDLRGLAQTGARPLALGAFGAVFISLFSLVLIVALT